MKEFVRTAVMWLVTVPGLAWSQEYVMWGMNRGEICPLRARAGAFDTVQLPFYDDFSNIDSGLSPARWAPSPSVYLNATFSAYPPSYGMVTLDGLTADRRPYRPGYVGNAAFATDTLTSLPIDLSGLSNADSVILSFFMDPGGVGDPPEATDSLVLQFLADSLLTPSGWKRYRWVNVWVSYGGDTSRWKYVALPIQSDSLHRFFHAGFQFRLIRYGNPGGNFDLWHLDYFYINKERSSQGIDWVDVSTVNAFPSVLKEYTAMPWHHFIRRPSLFLADSLFVDIHNLSNGPRNVTFQVSAHDMATHTTIFASPVYALNVATGQTHFSFANGFDYAAVDPDAPGVRLLYQARTFPDIFPSNDSLQFLQPFGNYFAYDDSSAEAGYGLINTTYGKVAVRFYLPEADTIRAIAIAFNESEVATGNAPAFHLAVWRKVGPDNSEQLIYQSRRHYPKIAPRIGNFYYYMLDTLLVLSGEVYVGWIQTENVFLNVGLDMNFPERHPRQPTFPHLYYYTQGQWRATSLAAVPLIRLVRGNPNNPIASVSDNSSPHIQLYPNPAQQWITIRSTPANPIQHIFVRSANGRQVYHWNGRSAAVEVNISTWKRGIYLLTIMTDHHVQYLPMIKQ